LALGVGYLTLTVPVYQASAKVRIGQIGGAGPFEAPDVLASRLLAEFGEDVATGVKRPYPTLTRVGPSRAGSSVVELVAVGYKPDDPARLLQRVTADLLGRHREIFERNSNAVSERIHSLETQRGGLHSAYQTSTKLLERFKPDDAAPPLIVAIERGRMAAAIAQLDKEKLALEQSSLPPSTAPSELLGQITAPAKPIQPKKTIIVVLSLLIGALLGTMGAFLAEFFAKARALNPSVR
jgi:hypothetical protein